MKSTIERMDMEELVKLLGDKLLVGVYILQDGKFCYVNSSFPLITGYSANELIGKDSLQLVVSEDREMVRENAIKMLKGKLLSPYYFRVICKDSRIKWLMETVSSIQYRGRRATLGNYMEITERKQMEEALKESEERYKELANSITDVFFAMDEQLRYIYWNKASEILTGIRAEDALGKSLLEIFPDTPGLRRAEKVYRDVLRTQQPQIFVNDFDIEDRHYIFEISAYPSRGGISVFVKDITGRKQAEEALQESEERYRALFERSLDCVYVHDFEGNFLDANDTALKLLGYERDDILHLNFASLLSQDQLPKAFATLQQLKEIGTQKQVNQFRLRCKDGSFVDMETIAAVIYRDEKPYAIQGVGRDVTQRKKAEEALQKSKERYRTLTENAGEAILVVQDGVVKFINPKGTELSGYSIEDLGSTPFVNFIHPDDSDMVAGRYLKRLKGELVPQTYDFRIIRKDGDIRWGELNAVPISWEDRPAVLCFMNDITERKKMEQVLRQSEENYRALFDSSVIGTIVLDAETIKIVMANRAAAKMFGLSSTEETIGLNPLGFVPPEDRERVLELIKKNLFEQDLRMTNQFRAITKDGREIWISVTNARIMHEGKLAGLVSFTDITEQKLQNEKLIMTDRLASIGELAAGAAHELNNPLTSIIGFSQLLMEKEVPDDIREDLKLINNEAQRAANVTRNLLTFARKHAPVKQLNQINNIIEDVLKLRAYEHKINSIEVKRQLAPDLPEIMVDYFQMQQVFLNIIINAEYFMTEAPKRGTLTVTTEKQNGSLRISFTDDGPGIPPEDLRRIFDPFFTNKPAGKGTGLGLSICHGIVTEHGGQIYAKSELGEGATFIIELPLNGNNMGDVMKQANATEKNILMAKGE